MVFQQFGLGYGIEIRVFWSRKGHLITGNLVGGVKNVVQNGVEKLRNIKSKRNRDNFVDQQMVFH